jgi:YesN/AraC family two-component response regulator
MAITTQFPGVELYIAENGKIGFDLYKEYSPNIVITDINMPIMDGIQMTRLIRAENSEVTVIAVSGNTRDDCRMDAITAGVNHYMKKPISLDELFAVIWDI